MKSSYTYYTQNTYGDVVNLTDEIGAVTKSYTYDAFGIEKNIDDADTNAFRYCGEYYDKEIATIYLRARYYNPYNGLFVSRDSFASRNNDPLSLNLYIYCHNNPVSGTDCTGHLMYAIYLQAIISIKIQPLKGQFCPANSWAGLPFLFFQAAYNPAKRTVLYAAFFFLLPVHIKFTSKTFPFCFSQLS